MSLLACRLPIRLPTPFGVFRFFLVMKKHINFVAAWTAKTGSVSVLTKQETPNLLAMSTGKGSSVRTCIQTFSKEKISMLGLSPEVLAEIAKADHKSPVTFEQPISVNEVFGMDCKIQIIEAHGEEEALKLRILNRDKNTGVILGKDSNVKRNRDTKEPVIHEGKRVFRKTLLVPDTDEYQDILVTIVAASKPDLPITGEQSDEDADEVPVF